MPRYTDRPMHYKAREAREPSPAPEIGLSWWKAAHYDVIGDAIVPRSAPKPFVIKNVRAIRWDDLMRWGTTYAVVPGEQTAAPRVRRAGGRPKTAPRPPLTDAVRQDMCAWCEEFGLPAYVLATTRAILLPREVEERAPASPEEQQAGPHWDSFVTTYMRVGAMWVTSLDHIPDGDVDDDAGAWDAGALVRDDVPCQDHSWLAFNAGERAAPSGVERLSTCLTVGVADCPRPGSRAFWKVYREPVRDMLLAGRLLARVRDELNEPLKKYGYSPSAYHLLQGLGWVLDGQGLPVWTASSLLPVYAHWRLVGGAPVRVCPGCGLPFAAIQTKMRFCDERCQKRMQQRRLRAAKKKGRPVNKK